MGSKKWTPAEVEYIKNSIGKLSWSEIGEQIGRSASAVQAKASAEGLTPRNVWKEEEDEFLKENYLTLGAEEVSKHLGRSLYAVHSRVRLVGGGRDSLGSRKEWSKEELDFLRENYHAMSVRELSEHLGRTEDAIYVRVQKIGIKKYVEPFSFFQDWSEEVAYAVGFFAADGSVNIRGPESVRIEFSQKERGIIDKLHAAIGYGNIVPRSNGMFELYIQSVKTYEWLCTIFGADVCSKSNTLAWPAIPDEFTRHFVRGAFDGDGSLFLRDDGYWSMSYTTGSPRFAYALAGEILYNTGIDVSIGENKIGVWHVRKTGQDVAKVVQWIYGGANIYLERKMKLAQDIMDVPEGIH